MHVKMRKALAVLQIILQLFPPSFLLYLSPISFANAKAENSSRVKSAEQADDRIAQTVVQAGTVLASENAADSVVNSLTSTATGMASAEAQQWLNQFGTARVSVSTDEHFTLNDSELELLLPLYDQKNNLLFTQLGGRRHDDRNIMNTGLGYRYFTETWMVGSNVFYDRQLSGNQHQRLGIGAELGWDYIKLSANGYFRLSDWMSSRRYTDYDERVANGFDIRATGYLPAYPQLGANIIYEQYYGDSVGLFGDDENDRQKNPHAMTFGLNYTPVPLVTVGVNQKFGKSGENDTQINFALSWTPGVPLRAQLDPAMVAQRRSLVGGRKDLVDRNNNIVLEYRKQDLITLSLPPQLEGEEQSKQTVTAKVKTKYALDHIDWQAASFLNSGGKITHGAATDQVVLTLPAWQSSGSNSYTLTGQAWDKNGNASNTSEMTVNVKGIDINTLQSSTSVSPTTIPADGASTATVTISLKTQTAENATGLASRLSATLISTAADTTTRPDAKKPTLADFDEISPGVYSASLTSGTIPDTLTIQPLIDGAVKLASAKLVEEKTETLARLSTLEASTGSALADGSTAVMLTATVLDSSGAPVQNEPINWSADNRKAQLSVAQSTTNDQGQAQVAVTSVDVISTVITAQRAQAESLQSETLNFTADSASARVVSVEPEKTQVIANNEDTSTLTAKVFDNYNHPLDGITVNWTVFKSNGSTAGTATSVTNNQGEATFQLKSMKIGAVTVSAGVTGGNAIESEAITFVADTSTQKVSVLQSDKQQATANGRDAIIYEATITDLQGNPVQGAVINWSADSQDATLSESQTLAGEDGKSTISVASLKAGAVVITAQTSESTAKQAESVNFIADAATAKIVALSGNNQTALANNTDAIQLSATVMDAHDNVLPDADVTWSVTPVSGTLSAQSSKTNSEGVAQARLTSAEVNTYRVTASINESSQSLSDLSFTADKTTAEITQLEADKETAIVADKDSVVLTATVVDVNQHAVSGVTIHWSSSEANSAFTASSAVTDENGQATTTFSSLKAGDITVTAALEGNTHTKVLQVIGNAATAKITTVAADKNEAVADGVSAVTWTAVVSDANDNALNGLTVDWSADQSYLAFSSTSSLTAENGEATIRATSIKSGETIVTASIASPAMQYSANAVNFIGDAKTAKVVKLAANLDHVAANTEPVVYTATIQDENGNPVEAAVVAWSTDMNSLSAQTSVTNHDGEATVKLSGSEFGKPTVIASTNGSSLSDNSVMFMGTIDESWNIANGAQPSSYKGETIANLKNLGFIVTGNTTGPTELIWSMNYGGYSELTAQLTDENGVSQTVAFRGQVTNQCTAFEFNSASGCQYPGNAPKITYDPSYGNNAALPAGKYHGVITFDGKDWHSSWALSYTVTTTLTIL
ncbi:Ig-like domain-containing protein [Citrobacter sp. Igbk 14]|uniref:Ig-like domain-containing protein n=1 Tax=Citrobacter sp. Igbk 14 TaxID=2963960 RepID=UPI002302BB0B|nr:inverse autotransporter beta domain-containing protein [Citrobacter sp. Igbk 14]MDA8512161.1 inverse autotransporter beta domain-containing protein [Citrobacter sp. Igbk 14]